MKNCYKKIKSLERKSAPSFHKIQLINMLINLKSFDVRIYKDPEMVKQLKYVLRRQKSWNGDVKLWFWGKYFQFVTEQSFSYSWYGNRHAQDILPF